MARIGARAYTPELAEEVIAGIAAGLTDKDAVLAAGISEDTWGRWLKGNRGAPAELADRVARARPRRTRRWLGKLWQLAESGNVAAIDSLLDRCAPEYRKKTGLEVTGKDGAPIAFQPEWVEIRTTILAILTDHPDALAKIAERLAELEGGNG